MQERGQWLDHIDKLWILVPSLFKLVYRLELLKEARCPSQMLVSACWTVVCIDSGMVKDGDKLHHFVREQFTHAVDRQVVLLLKFASSEATMGHF